MVIDNLLTDSEVTATCAEQHAIGDNRGAATTKLKHSDKECHKQKFGLLGLSNSKQRFAYSIVVETTCKWWISKAEGITILVSIIGRKAISILNIWVIYTVEHKVHSTDTKHCGVGIKTVQKTTLIVLHILGVKQLLLAVLLNILSTLDNKTRRAHSRVADSILNSGLHKLDHHLDNMARGTELSIITTRSHLAQDILIYIAHSVTVVHIQSINALDNLNKCAWVLNHKGSVSHKSTICRLLASVKILDKGKGITTNDAIHLLSLLILEHTPSQGLVWHILIHIGVVPHTLTECRVFDSHTHNIGISLLGLLSIVQHLHKEEIGHLLQHCHRVGNTARKKCIPY